MAVSIRRLATAHDRTHTSDLSLLAGGDLEVKVTAVNGWGRLEGRFVEAIRRDDISDVLAIGLREHCVNEMQGTRDHSLRHARSKGMFDALISLGANLSRESFQSACGGLLFGSPEIVRWMIQSGCEVNPPDVRTHESEEKRSPLIAAAWSGAVRRLDILLEHGADPDAAMYQSNWTALHCAVNCVNTKMDLKTTRRQIKRRALFWRSTDFGDFRGAVRFLGRAGANLECPNDLGQTPLMQAARATDYRTAKMLLTFGANPLSACYGGRSSLQWAEGKFLGLKPERLDTEARRRTVALLRFSQSAAEQTVDSGTGEIAYKVPAEMISRYVYLSDGL